MRTVIRTLTIAAFAAAVSASAQISILPKEVVMINGDGTPVLNGPLGSFVGNVGTNTGTRPPMADGHSGNVPVDQIATTPLLTPALLEAAALAIQVPAEFEARPYGLPPLINNPTSVAAAPDGTIFVGMDSNGASSAYDHMGRVMRLKDTNGDGVADQVTAFIPDLNSVRGVLWDYDHLLVLAAPTITAYYDRNNDGVADEKKVLISGFGRTLADARVDHGQNTLEAGIDGFIYVALGDQGVNGAVGTDGRKLTMRGGGVVRFRPDGSGLEVWAHNTRNIYGISVGPTLEVFGRDNTNDGGGWNVRFHHFSGMTDHGYPSLFTNFPNEVVTPLADFGGGSGTGGMWLDEPGIPAKWNDLPYTQDFGQRATFAHHVQPNGATYTLPGYAVQATSVNGVPLRVAGPEVPAGNEPFIQLANQMDVDVDGNSAIYTVRFASGIPAGDWSSASGVWRIVPKNFKPAPLPNFDTISAAELVQVLAGDSNVRRLSAQRAILRRSAQLGTGIDQLLLTLANDRTKSLNNRTAALFTYKQLRGAASTAAIARMVSDPTIAALAIRALGNDLEQAKSIPIAVVTGALKSTDARTRKEALITLARAGSVASAPLIAPLMGDADPIVAHTAIQVLRSLRAIDQAFSVIDDARLPAQVRWGALQVLHSFHEAKVTDGLIQRLRGDQPVASREEIVSTLARLQNTETAWNGTWWATRPQNVGPYFAAAPWAESTKIQEALNGVLDRAGPEEVLAIGRTFQKEGVSAGPAVAKFLAYADSEPTLVPQITAYFATAETIPSNAIPVLTKVASTPGNAANVRAQAISALARTGDRPTWEAIFPAIKLLNAPAAAAAGGRGAAGGGRGGAAPAAAGTTIPNATQLQNLLVADMDAANAALLQAVTTARTAALNAAFTPGVAPATLTARANDVAAAEQALASARADAFRKIQASIAKLSPQQAAVLATQQAVATPPAAAPGGRGGGGGGGGRGGAAAATPAQQAQQAVINTPRIDDIYQVLVDEAAKLDGENSQLADAALLILADRKFGNSAPRNAAAAALDAGWADPRRRAQIIMAEVTARDSSRATQIVAALNDSDAGVARAARYAVQQLNIDPAALAAAATQPKIGSMEIPAVLDAVATAKGSIPRGQQLARDLGCVSCHTFDANEPPKGPDLSKISAILPRRDLAEAILNPNKSISQGFGTITIQLRNGTRYTGFIVTEGGGTVTLRDAATRQTKIANSDIASRTQVELSVMPGGLASGLTVTEFASLLDYIESLSKP